MIHTCPNHDRDRRGGGGGYCIKREGAKNDKLCYAKYRVFGGHEVLVDAHVRYRAEMGAVHLLFLSSSFFPSLSLPCELG